VFVLVSERSFHQITKRGEKVVRKVSQKCQKATFSGGLFYCFFWLSLGIVLCVLLHFKDKEC
ncbi:MAG: hypothetical protein OQK67_07400, partial [Chlorobium sp.]|nr:hypothetical protein [Chlorobium sp.]MCW8816227.1 hypothetical protein [Chlorobium sp.]MCW8819623.1 hypothetical protein [Ignavibacteriaceae bacterium]